MHMNTLKNIIYKSCFYCVILLTVFFSFVTLDQGAMASIPFSSFLFVLAIGIVIALTGLVFSIQSIPQYAKIAIQFSVLLASFYGILAFIGQFAGKGPSVYIVVGFAFAVIYTLV